MDSTTSTAVAYMRCSGRSQVDGDTWDRQIAAISACCAARELQFLREYREEAVPGKSDEDARPAFQAMVADLLGNGCRTIVVESLDRLARQYDIQQRLAEYLASKGIALISANTNEDITAALMGDPMRRAMVQVQGIFAELDKNMLIAKLRKARERKKEKTGKGEGRHAYGEKTGEAEILAEILDLDRRGLSCRNVASALNKKQLPTRAGGPWLGSTVAKILARSRLVT